LAKVFGEGVGGGDDVLAGLYLGRPEEALAAYDQAVALDPSNSGAYSGRGYMLNVLGRPEEALAAHKQAITLSPRNSYVHTGRGVTLRILGWLEEALAAHDHAIALNCCISEAYDNRGITLRDLGRHEEALAAHDQAIALNPQQRLSREDRHTSLRSPVASIGPLTIWTQPNISPPLGMAGIELSVQRVVCSRVVAVCLRFPLLVSSRRCERAVLATSALP